MRNQIIADLARARAEYQRRTLLAILTQSPLDAEAQKHVEGDALAQKGE